MKVDIGEFKNVVNVFIKDMINAWIEKNMMGKFKEEKQKLMNVEITKLNIALKALDKTIVNIKHI